MSMREIVVGISVLCNCGVFC